MNFEELRLKLRKEGSLEEKCCFDEVGEKKHCLIHQYDEWVVFYYEDGVKYNTMFFSNEEDACVYFYRHMLYTKLYTPSSYNCCVKKEVI